jgi:hypothetical protein
MSRKKGVVDKNWTRFLESLPLYDEPPPGYLNVQEFAERANSTSAGVVKACKAGKIAPQHCLTFPDKKNKRRLAFNWNSSGYNFIMLRNAKYWPDDFEPNDEFSYRPLDVPDTESAAIPPSGGLTDGDEKISFRKVTDIASAKYRVEQLKIAQMQTALKEENNQLVRIEDVAGHEREMALEIKAAVRKESNKMAPLLAKATTVLECRSILDAGHREALETLNPMLLENGDGKDEKA